MRNTPAYTGKTLETFHQCENRKKHPRVCGEDSTSLDLRSTPSETPPRMRGRLPVGQADRVGQGNTPAYAGKTRGCGGAQECRQKHPRVCGEDPSSSRTNSWPSETPPRMRGRLPALHVTYSMTETPPRMRGRRLIPDRAQLSRRNTPAYAGKTVPRFR